MDMGVSMRHGRQANFRSIFAKLLLFPCLYDGGADRNRTCDLLIANETLCQLSYDPNKLTKTHWRWFAVSARTIDNLFVNPCHPGMNEVSQPLRRST